MSKRKEFKVGDRVIVRRSPAKNVPGEIIDDQGGRMTRYTVRLDFPTGFGGQSIRLSEKGLEREEGN